MASTEFKIRMVAGVSILFADGFCFDILDVTNNLLCVYDYRGINKGIASPISVNTRGPWNAFKTRVSMEVNRFGGLARFMAAGVGDKCLMGLSIEPAGKPPVEIIPFQTGFEFGMGFGFGAGALTQMFPPIPAREAPWPHNT